MVDRILGAPRLYVQGAGALDRLGALVAPLGRAPFVVADPVALGKLRPRLDVLRRARFEPFSGECTAAEIDRLAGLCEAAGADAIIALGGGKAIDTGKGVALERRLPIAVVPTAASSDAPTSRLIVVYDETHRIVEVRRLPFNPDLVLVDTAVVAEAPPRLLAAGIGDALSKKFEVEHALGGGGTNFFGGTACAATVLMADACWTLLRRHGGGAMRAVAARRVTEDLERTVEATILLSGLAFESGGLWMAHALTRGFSAHPATRSAMHGETVAFGLLVQLVLEERADDFMADLLGFYGEIGLPRTLAELGLGDTDAATLRAIATPSLATSYAGNTRLAVDAERLALALRRADALGRASMRSTA